MEAHKQQSVCPAGICPSHCPHAASCPARHLVPTATAINQSNPGKPKPVSPTPNPASGLYHALAAVRYWNRNQFDGRFKTMETERAEALLRANGIDPASVGTRLPWQRPAKGGAANARPKRPLPPH